MAGRIPLHMLRRRGKQTPGVPRHAASQRDLRDPVAKAEQDITDLKNRTKRLKGDAAKKVRKDLKKLDAKLKAAKVKAKVDAADVAARVKAGAASRAKAKAAPVVEALVVDDAAEKAFAEAEKAAEEAAAAAEAAVKAKAAEEAANAAALAEAFAAEAEAKAAEEAAAAAAAVVEVEAPSMEMHRDQLDAVALEAGVPEPDKLPNKQAVLDAILAKSP